MNPVCCASDQFIPHSVLCRLAVSHLVVSASVVGKPNNCNLAKLVSFEWCLHGCMYMNPARSASFVVMVAVSVTVAAGRGMGVRGGWEGRGGGVQVHSCVTLHCFLCATAHVEPLLLTN